MAKETVWASDHDAGEDVVQGRIDGSVEDERRVPRQPAVGASGDDDVVEVRVGPFLETALTRGIDREHGVGRRIRDDRTLVVIERRHAREAILARYRARYGTPCESVVIGTLHVDEGARTAVVVRDVHGQSVGRHPLAVSL